MQALQQQVSDAQAAKAKVEQDRSALEKQLKGKQHAAAQTSKRATLAQREAEDKLKASDSAKALLATQLADLQKQLDEQRRSHEQTLSSKDRELAQLAQGLKVKEGERGEWQTRFGEQARLVTDCGNKNDRLSRLNAELIGNYKNKGVMDALRQREPVLGLREVQVFNQTQDQRDRAELERFTPALEPR
jgi:chromosome segregation ATPase